MTKNVKAGSPRYNDCFEEIHALIKGAVPIIWVQTHEEARFIEEFHERIAEPETLKVWLWSCHQGLVPLEQADDISEATGEFAGSNAPKKALEKIVSLGDSPKFEGQCFIMRDFHEVLSNAIPRQVRDMYFHLMHNEKTLIITSPLLAHGPMGSKSGLPDTLEKQISVVKFDLPNKNQVAQKINDIVNYMKIKAEGKSTKNKLEYTTQDIQDFTKALQGLTMNEVENSVSTSFSHMGELNINKLLNDKRQLIRKSQILEFVNTDIVMDDVGGLDLAKEYLSKYSTAHHDDAKAFGVEPLKGLLLTGVPGTGKSLLAKAIGMLWKMPLLRLDVGRVMTGLVGGSEAKMRDVIDQVEAISPCCLWIDEVEKSLSGTKSSNSSDGGTLARVFGTLLTAMQDGMEGVTVIATANDISQLPPEFIRRFNEVFFVDLPGPDERWDIFDIHLRKRGRKISDFNKIKGQLLAASENYTGAEIEKSIQDALAAAYYAKQKDVTPANLLLALKDTKPIFQVMKDKVEYMRTQAQDSFRYASSYSKLESKKHQVKTEAGTVLDIDEAIGDMNDYVHTGKQKSAIEKGKNRYDGLLKDEKEQLED